MEYSYSDIYNKLSYEVAFVRFEKRDGQLRDMICTRNLETVGILHDFQGAALGGHDKRCNIRNGNIAVMDLVLGEARSFNISRLQDIQFQGEITKKGDLERVMEGFIKFRDNKDIAGTGNGGNGISLELSFEDI